MTMLRRFRSQSTALISAVVSAMLMLLLAACSSFGSGPSGEAQDSAGGTPIAPTPLPTKAVASRSSVSADGVMALASPVLPLAFETVARVAAVNVEVGQMVKRGDLLATLDDSSLREALADAKLNQDLTEAQIRQQANTTRKEDIDSAKAAYSAAVQQYNVIKRGPTASEIEQARLSWEAAKTQYLSAQVDRDLACGNGLENPFCKQQEAALGNAYESVASASDRYQELLKPVSKEKLTQAYAGVVSAQTRLQALQAPTTDEQRNLALAQYNQAKSAVARAESNLRKVRLVSPCDCVVQEVNIAKGNLPSGPAFTLVDLSGLLFKTTNLSERDVAAIKEGSAASIRLKAFEQAVTGKVSSILAQSSGSQGGAALFTVLIALDAPNPQLLPGMTGQAEIALR